MTKHNAKAASVPQEDTTEAETKNKAEEIGQAVGSALAVSGAASVPSTAVGAMPSALMSRMVQDAGKGTSKAAEDNIVPIIGILQVLSPQAQVRNPAYVKDAMPGDIFIKNLNPPVISGEEGFLFQPCHFQKKWVRWIPRTSGGGFIGAYDEADKPKCREVIDDPKQPNRKRYVVDDNTGHELIETRYHIGLAHFAGGRVLPFVIPFSQSGHTESRNWMFQMNSLQLPDGAGTVPSFATLYRMKTKERTNKVGQVWYAWDIQHEGYVQSEVDYQRGADLDKAFATGEKEAAALDDTVQQSETVAENLNNAAM